MINEVSGTKITKIFWEFAEKLIRMLIVQKDNYRENVHHFS